MLGTIENLEKDIELFQKNIAASGEMVQLLKQMLEQIKLQNEEFDVKSQGLISRIDGLPATINDANSASNLKIKSDVASELEKSLQNFSIEQTRYLQGLELTKQQVQNYVEQIQTQEKMTADRVSTVLTKVDGIPNMIEAENAKSNLEIKSGIAVELDKAVKNFALEQAKYLQDLDRAKQQMKGYVEQVHASEKTSTERIKDLIEKVESILSAIEAENLKSNALLKDNISLIIEGAIRSFSKEQESYMMGLSKMQANIKKCEEGLEVKYREFIDSLEKMNISNLYEQNVQLKNSLDKKTLILMLISGVSLVIGIVGLFV